ncbi:MAG: hypothetical protein L0Y44_11115 [Phycisphaerales bacterium]|nr:hypothetical protein [Phycisphaerales bacterium]MCI0631189.1 hypothetical protein [Phycisphaerales bacterium]MCI0676414.1 hypothetical protein [Phycisphaerales bacterium]
MTESGVESSETRALRVEALQQFDRELARELDERARSERESLQKILDGVFEDQAVLVARISDRASVHSARLSARG